jgi:transcriptional regulator with XRE-family HTH domain
MDPMRDLQPGRLLGMFLASRRKAIGMTQQEVADKVGKEQWWISQFERGRAVMLPSPDEFHGLVDAVGSTDCEALEFIGFIRRQRGGTAPTRVAPVAVFARLAVEIDEAELPEDAKGIIQRAIRYASEVAELEGPGNS